VFLASNTGSTIYTGARAEAGILSSADGRVSVKQTCTGETSVLSLTIDALPRRRVRAIANVSFALRSSGFVRVNRLMRVVPQISFAVTTVAAASNTVFTSALSNIRFTPAAIGEVPSFSEILLTPSAAVATRVQQTSADLLSYASGVMGDGDVERRVAASASLDFDTYGSAGFRLPTGGYVQYAYGSSVPEFTTNTDDRLVLRFFSGLSLITFDAEVAGVRRITPARASTSVISLQTGARNLVTRTVLADSSNIQGSASGQALRILPVDVAALLFFAAHSYPAADRSSKGQVALFYTATAEAKLAEKATGDSSLLLSAAVEAKLAEKATGDSSLLLSAEAEAKLAEKATGDSSLLLSAEAEARHLVSVKASASAVTDVIAEAKLAEKATGDSSLLLSAEAEAKLAEKATGGSSLLLSAAVEAKLAEKATGEAAFSYVIGGEARHLVSVKTSASAVTDIIAEAEAKLAEKATGGSSLLLSAAAEARHLVSVKASASAELYFYTGSQPKLAEKTSGQITAVFLADNLAIRHLKPVYASGSCGLWLYTEGTAKLAERTSGRCDLWLYTEGTAKLAEKTSGTAIFAVESTAKAAHVIAATALTVVLDTHTNGGASYVYRPRGSASIVFSRIDATALSNLTTPAPVYRSFIIEQAPRGIIVPEQIRTIQV